MHYKRNHLARRVCLLACLLLPASLAPLTLGAVSTNVPVTAELATKLADSAFPISIKLTQGNLFLTKPHVIFLTNEKVALRARVQAYDHRPDAGVALSEMAWAEITAVPGYDPNTRQILLHHPQLKDLHFDRDNDAARGFQIDIRNSWAKQVSNPVRAAIPNHPYLAPIRRHISNLSYDGNSINLTLEYR